jgi:hypothetical protein
LTKRALVAPHQQGWVCGTGCARVRLTARHEAAEVFEALSTAATDSWLNEHAVGTTMKNLNTDIVARIPVPRPEGASAGVRALQAMGEELRQLAALVARTREARDAIAAVLLTGERSLPAGYDRFLEAV